jgi:hypothetical protein
MVRLQKQPNGSSHQLKNTHVPSMFMSALKEFITVAEDRYYTDRHQETMALDNIQW